MRYLGVDPGNTTAIACLEGYTLLSTTVVKMGPASITRKKEKIKVPMFRRLRDYYDTIEALIFKLSPEIVVLEEPFMSPKFPQAGKSMNMKLALIQLACSNTGVKEVRMMNPSVVKKVLSGDGKMDKAILANLVQGMIDNPEAMDILIKEQRYDETDAVAICLAGRNT